MRLLAPTRIYVKALLQALEVKRESGAPAIKGMAHITGGGLTENIPRVIPDGLKANIDASSWPLPEIFKWLKTEGNLDNDDLARTLNCGLGMIVICDPDKAAVVERSLSDAGETVYTIGEISSAKLSDIPISIENRAKSWS